MVSSLGISQSMSREKERVCRQAGSSELQKLVAEAGESSGTGERPLLEAVTKQSSEDRDCEH
jgi:hypothetical protein